MQLEPESDAAVSDQKKTQLEEDLYAVTEIEQRLLDAFPPDDGYLLTGTETWVVPTSQPYLRVLAHLENIAARGSPAGIISVEECNALMRVCVCHLSLFGYFLFSDLTAHSYRRGIN